MTSAGLPGQGERDEVLRVGIEAVGGAVPVVAGVTGVSTEHAVERPEPVEDRTEGKRRQDGG